MGFACQTRLLTNAGQYAFCVLDVKITWHNPSSTCRPAGHFPSCTKQVVCGQLAFYSHCLLPCTGLCMSSIRTWAAGCGGSSSITRTLWMLSSPGIHMAAIDIRGPEGCHISFQVLAKRISDAHGQPVIRMGHRSLTRAGPCASPRHHQLRHLHIQTPDFLTSHSSVVKQCCRMGLAAGCQLDARWVQAYMECRSNEPLGSVRHARCLYGKS